MKPLRLLQRLQASNSASIFNPIRKERRQDLGLLSGKELGRECSDHSSQIRHGFAPQYRVFVVDVFAQGLHDFDQGGFLILDICHMDIKSQLESNNVQLSRINCFEVTSALHLSLIHI